MNHSVTVWERNRPFRSSDKENAMTTSTAWSYLDKSLQLLADATSGVSAEDFARPDPVQRLECPAGPPTRGRRPDRLRRSPDRWARSDVQPVRPVGRPHHRHQRPRRRGVATSATAWAGVPADSSQVEIPIPIGPVDAKVAAAACALDAAVHAWDVAVALGRPSPSG